MRSFIVGTLMIMVAVPATSEANLPAYTISRPLPVATHTYPTILPGGATGTAEWRVISNASGNPFENQLAASASGALLNWGGTYLRLSEDAGLTWQEVRGYGLNMLSAEGAVSAAPGGDIVGITWDPYSGDRLVAFRYSAGAWSWAPVPIHTPFYDRPWIAVMPGPFTVAGDTYPYIVVAKGGWPSKEVFLYSLDGLNYVAQGSKTADSIITPRIERWFDTQARPDLDVVQPQTHTRITPLARGGLAQTDLGLGCPTRTFVAPAGWSCFSLPDGGLPSARLLMDGAGRMHSVSAAQDAVTLQVSPDGGRTWNLVRANLPPGLVVENFDFRTSAAAGTTAVAIHAHRPATRTDQDVLMTFDTTADTPSLRRTAMIGLGDRNFGNGLGSTEPRFDFSSVAILPSGKVAVSFVDSEHVAAAIAIEL